MSKFTINFHMCWQTIASFFVYTFHSTYIIGFSFFPIIHLAVHKEAIRLGHDFNHQPKITVDFICKSNWMELSQSLNNKQVLNCSLPFSRSQPDISLALTNLSFLRRRRSCWWTTIVSTYVSMGAKASMNLLVFEHCYLFCILYNVFVLHRVLQTIFLLFMPINICSSNSLSLLLSGDI